MNKIKNGDRVFVEFIGPMGNIFNTIAGIISGFEAEDGPSCLIDGEPIDLASEGHTSVMRLSPPQKILIIGQAPPAVEQTVPYDTTLLYDMLAWVGITKAWAQEVFDFDAMSGEFPGHGQDGHLLPAQEQVRLHYESVLVPKIRDSKGILVLGNFAKEELDALSFHGLVLDKPLEYLIHPSKRNTARINEQKSQIQQKLTSFLMKARCV